MGTRSLVVVKDNGKNSEEICTIYKHWDGYPSGLGMDLFKYFCDFKIVNGLSCFNPKIANGMGCLAAQIVTNLKNDVLKREKQYALERTNSDSDKHNGMAGDISIYPPGTRDCWEEYIYTFYCEEPKKSLFAYGTLMLEVKSVGVNQDDDVVMYDGPISGYKDWLDNTN